MGMLMGAQMSDAFEGRAKDILPLAIEEGRDGTDCRA